MFILCNILGAKKPYCQTLSFSYFLNLKNNIPIQWNSQLPSPVFAASVLLSTSRLCNSKRQKAFQFKLTADEELSASAFIGVMLVEGGHFIFKSYQSKRRKSVDDVAITLFLVLSKVPGTQQMLSQTFLNELICIWTITIIWIILLYCPGPINTTDFRSRSISSHGTQNKETHIVVHVLLYKIFILQGKCRN